MRTPEPPTSVESSGSTCGSLSLTWRKPGGKGFEIEGYEVVYTSTTSASSGSFEVLGGEPATEVTGLSPSTTYQLRVRARSRGGAGMLSTPISATTSAALHRPQPPTASPTLHASDCSSLTLKAPPLRHGCAGDEWLALEWRDAAAGAEGGSERGWRRYDADGGAVREGQLVTLFDLDPRAAYQARVLASNSEGPAAEPGPASNPFLPGAESPETMMRPPVARATGMASVLLSWDEPRGNCLLEPSPWEVLVRRLPPADPQAAAAAAAADEWWTTIAVGVPSVFEVAATRCPQGCSFRTHLVGVGGWSLYSNGSVPVVTPPEPPIPRGAARVELEARLDHGLEAGGAAPAPADEFAAGLAQALNVDSSRVALAYTYTLSGGADGGGTAAAGPAADKVAEPHAHLVIDLLPDPSAALEPDPSDQPLTDPLEMSFGASSRLAQPRDGPRSPAELADLLADLMSAKSRVLTSRPSTAGIRFEGRLVRVYADGELSVLWSGDFSAGLAQTLALLTEARLITVALVGGALLLGCCVQVGRMRRRESERRLRPARARFRFRDGGDAEERMRLTPGTRADYGPPREI